MSGIKTGTLWSGDQIINRHTDAGGGYAHPTSSVLDILYTPPDNCCFSMYVRIRAAFYSSFNFGYDPPPEFILDYDYYTESIIHYKKINGILYRYGSASITYGNSGASVVNGDGEVGEVGSIYSHVYNGYDVDLYPYSFVNAANLYDRGYDFIIFDMLQPDFTSLTTLYNGGVKTNSLTTTNSSTKESFFAKNWVGPITAPDLQTLLTPEINEGGIINLISDNAEVGGLGACYYFKTSSTSITISSSTGLVRVYNDSGTLKIGLSSNISTGTTVKVRASCTRFLATWT
jgi:hypothetical protein